MEGMEEQGGSMLLYPGGAAPPGWDLVVEAVEALLAPGTRAVYASHWRKWQEWCSNNNVSDLPATPESMAIYLAYRAQRHSMNTVRTAAAAIGAYHTQAGCENPAAHIGVRKTLGGLANQYPGRPRQVQGLTAIRLAGIAATAHMPRYRESRAEAQLRGITDLAMIGLMRDSLLRRGEAAALTWDDLTEESDGSGRLYIAHSKTDQTGEGAVAFVSRQTMGWLREMRETAGEREAILGLCSHQIARRIVSAAAAAGLPGRYGGHSPRVGMALDLTEAGIELPSLMQVGRWKSPTMPALYIRNLTAGHNAVASWYSRRGE